MDETYLIIIMFNDALNTTNLYQSCRNRNVLSFLSFCVHGRIQMSSLSDPRNPQAQSHLQKQKKSERQFITFCIHGHIQMSSLSDPRNPQVQPEPDFLNFYGAQESKEPISPGCVAWRGRYGNPLSTRFLAPLDCLKIPALTCRSRKSLAKEAGGFHLYLYLYLYLDFILYS